MIRKGPRAGSAVPVECTSHSAGVMRFAGGAIVQIATSCEVWAHQHTPLELYGTRGPLALPDANRFGGRVALCPADGGWQARPTSHRYADGNYRSLGLADMAAALREGRPHRASGELAYHVLEVMEALVRASEGGGRREGRKRVARSVPLAADLAVGALA